MTIVVTGVGAITSLGDSARETFERLLAGERGLRAITLFDPGDVRARLVAEIPRVFATTDDAATSRTSELALAAAREAIADAGLAIAGRRVGLVLGGTTAGMFETESFLATLLTSPESRRRDQALSKMLSHPLSAPTDRLVRELGPFTRARSLSSACSSGANALAVGATWLELGLVDAVVCGGADALCRVTVSGFASLQAVDPEGARPFDVARRGLTLGEGAGFVVLERATELGSRRARCALLGWASRSEAHHVTNPNPSGDAPLSAMRGALARAGLEPSDVDYVNAHGTGTSLNDAMEAGALARLFGDDVMRVAVSSQKGMIGHTLGAAGAIEAVVTALAIEQEQLPPTGGLRDPDPAFPLRHVRTTERRPIRTAISSSFGFGGMDTALVLGRAGQAGAGARARLPGKRRVVVTGLAALTPRGLFTDHAVADLVSASAGDALDVPDAVLEVDPERGRRLDRTSRAAAVLAERASVSADRDAGLVVGVAFGAVDATAAYMRRLLDKGSRLARPADFPTLVPSSPAGQTSIYLGLRGPAFVVADLATSGECALAQAYELVAAGDAVRMGAVAVEERSAIVEEVLSIVFGHAGAPRREGGAALSLAVEGSGPALARLGELRVWCSAADLGATVALEPPPARAVVVLADTDGPAAAIVDASAWHAVPRCSVAEAAGTHEAAGAIAAAVAVAKVARGDVEGALFVGSSRGYGYAGTVWRDASASQ